MNDNIFLVVAIIVFVLMAIGLLLTILEFRKGAPHQQQLESERQEHNREN